MNGGVGITATEALVWGRVVYALCSFISVCDVISKGESKRLLARVLKYDMLLFWFLFSAYKFYHLWWRSMTNPEIPYSFYAKWAIYLVLRLTRHRMNVDTSHDTVLVYAPSLLSAVLFECDYDPETIRVRGLTALRRAATPLSIPAARVPEVLRDTWELALCVCNINRFSAPEHS
jgi:hypothetical protein